MAFFGVLLMIAFVWIGPWNSGSGRGSGAKRDDTVVTWNYGEIREADLQNMLAMRRIVNEFLHRAFLAARNKAYRSFQTSKRIPEHMPRQIGFPFAESEEQVVRSKLLAKKAEQAGIVVGEQAINDYIAQVTGNLLSPNELGQIVLEISGKQFRVTQPQLFDALAEELAALNYSRLFVGVLNDSNGDPVAQRWDYFNRQNRQVTVDVLPVKVESFMTDKKLPQPKLADLKAFYEQNKNRYASDDSAEPGFKQPFMAQLEYFKIEKTAQIKAIEVSDEDIQAYYDKHKDEFKKVKLPSADLGPDKKGEEPKTGVGGGKSDLEPRPTDTKPDAKPDEKQPDGKKPDEKKPEAKPDEKSAADKKPAPVEKPDAGKKPADNKPPATEKKDGPKKDGPKKDGASRDSSPATQFAGRPAVAAVLAGALFAPDEPVANQAGADKPADKSADKQDAAPKEESPDKEADKSDKKSAPDSPASKADEKPAADNKAKGEKAKDEKAKGDKDDEKGPAGLTKKKADDDVPDDPASLYEPLNKANKAIIRDRLARERFGEKLRPIVDEIQNIMQEYSRKYSEWKAGASKEPQRPDFAAPIALNKLSKPITTQPLTANQFFDQGGIGQSNSSRALLVNMAFNPKSPLFRPMVSEDADFFYISWKVAAQPEQIPEFDQIKDQVAAKWKFVKARALAKKQAEEYLEQIRKAKKSLAEFVKDDKDAPSSKEVGPFTWMTGGSGSPDLPNSQPRLTNLRELDRVGDDFMRAVYSLELNDLTWTVNEPQSVYYVVQLVKQDPDDEILRIRFQTSMAQPSLYANIAQVSEEDRGRSLRIWLDALDEEFGVKWRRDPVAPRQNESADNF